LASLGVFSGGQIHISRWSPVKKFSRLENSRELRPEFPGTDSEQQKLQTKNQIEKE